MSSAKTSLLTNALDLEGLLKRASIEKITLGLKLGLVGLTLVCLGFIVNSAVQHIFAGASTVTEIKNKVSEAKITPAVDHKQGRRNYQSISRSELFGDLGKEPEKTKVDSKPATELALTLIGTFIADGEPFAIIEDQKKKNQEVFVINDDVFGEAKVKKIYSDRVEIDRAGRIEVLVIDDSPSSGGDSGEAVSAVSDTEFLIDEAELNKSLENLPLLLTQARAVPYFRDGQSIGLRMFAIKSGSLFQKIGLTNGDILKSINGNSLSDITQAMKIFEQLKQERSLSVTLERNKEEKEFRYQVK